jgi:ATP-dependent RNA helicase DHX34
MKESSETENEKDTSIHHLEFSLKYDVSDLLAKSDTSALNRRDENLVRLILCSGVYPNIAIADDANAYRPNTEQVFHTKEKRFVKMLPTSVFATQPETLHPREGILINIIQSLDVMKMAYTILRFYCLH